MYHMTKMTKYICKQLLSATLWIVVASNELSLGKSDTKLQETVKGDSLQFWSRDPKFDTTRKPIDVRRRADRRINRFRPLYDEVNRHQGLSIEENKQFGKTQFNQGHPVKPNRNYRYNHPLLNNSLKHANHPQSFQSIYFNEKDRRSQNRNHLKRTSDGNKNNAVRVTSAAAKDIARLPKHKGIPLRSNSFQHEGSTPDSKSTRMLPMVLMQQEEEMPKSQEKVKDPIEGKEKDKNWYLNRFILNPYAIIEQFDKLMSNFPHIEVTKEILGLTAEYNKILLLKITRREDIFMRANNDKYVQNERREKKIVFIVHALSAMGLNNLYSLTVESYLKQLLSYYLAHLDKFDIYLMPLANPDGYLKNRDLYYWTKNFSPQAECNGVALDRNFDVAWNSSAKDMSSCHPQYPGPRPFSEPESSAVRDVFHKYSHKIIAYFHVHPGTYDHSTFKGDAVLYPKGYTDIQTDDDRYVDLRGDIDEAIKNADFRIVSVTVDTLYNWYGRISGSSVDYAASVYGVPYSMELVMQSYMNPTELSANLVLLGYYHELENDALTQIWSRVINVIFTNIWEKLQAKDD